jgi:Domain of unknown function (DUF4175)
MSEAWQDPVSGAQAPQATRVQALVLAGERALAEVDARFRAARNRARWQALAQVGLSAIAGMLGAALLSAAAAARLGPGPGRALLGASLLAGIAAIVAFRRRSVLQQAAARGHDPVAMARLYCAAGARRELLSSMELRASPPEGTSRELLALLHQRASDEARRLPLEEALPARILRAPSLALAATLLAALLASALFHRPLRLGAMRLVLGEAAAPPTEPEPIAGDLQLTYLYPAYTGLPPRVEEGTTGDLHAPKGTEVKLSARADRDLEQAFAVYNGEPVKLEAAGPGRRQLSGSLKLLAPGRWHLRFADGRGRAVAEGPPRPVEIVADQPPQASISEPQKSEVEVDPQGRLVLHWSATDDYGLGSVALVFQKPGEKEERVPLGAPPSSEVVARRLSGSYSWELGKLGLRAGDRVPFRVEALDQDALDGPKKGSSAQHTLKVFSLAEHHREAIQRVQQLWERLLSLLADRLEERPAPVGEAEGAPWYQASLGRDRAALQLSQDLGRAGRELSADKFAPKALARALKNTFASYNPLVQRTVIARSPLQKGAAGHEGQARILTGALAAEVRELEKDVLYLEDLLDQARIDDLREVQRELAESRRELQRLAEKLKSAPDEAAKKALLAEVSRLRERVQELMQRMAELAKGIRDEHLNQEALETVGKEEDLMGQLSDIQRKLQGGDVDEALRQLDALGKMLQKLEDQLDQKTGERAQEKYAEEGKALREAAAKLSALRERESRLEQKTAQLRRQQGEEARRQFEQKGGKELQKRLLEKAKEAKKEIGKIDPKVAEPLGLDDALDGLSQRVDELQQALQAGDFAEALEQSQRAELLLQRLKGRLSFEEQVRQLPDQGEVRRAHQASQQAHEAVKEISQKLAQAMPSGPVSPQQRSELERQQAEQRDLKQQLQGVRDQLAQVGKKVPVFGPQHEQLLQEAQGAMEQAEQKLGQGEPRAAQSGEGQALEKLEKFEQAMKEMAKQGGKGGQGMPMPWGEPGSERGDEGEGGDASQERVEIPDAESSRGPQEFRKKLLDAMKQPPPEKFKDRVKQYYEELVK